MNVDAVRISGPEFFLRLLFIINRDRRPESHESLIQAKRRASPTIFIWKFRRPVPLPPGMNVMTNRYNCLVAAAYLSTSLFFFQRSRHWNRLLGQRLELPCLGEWQRLLYLWYQSRPHPTFFLQLDRGWWRLNCQNFLSGQIGIALWNSRRISSFVRFFGGKWLRESGGIGRV